MKYPIKLLAIGLLLASCVYLALCALHASNAPMLFSIIPSDEGAIAPAHASVADVRFKELPIAAFSQTRDKPIFFEGRTYPEIVAAVAEQTPAASGAPPRAISDHLRLQGVQIAKDARKALIKSSNNSPTWYVLGDAIDGWIVTEIGPDHATLQSGSSIVQLRLYDPLPNHELTPE